MAVHGAFLLLGHLCRTWVYFRMIAIDISVFLYIFCVFYVSFLELVIVLSSKYYFVCLASIWHLVGVGCVETAFRYSYFI